MNIFGSLWPPYCPSGTSFKEYNKKGERICVKPGDQTQYRFEKDADCNKVVENGNYKLIEEKAVDACDKKQNKDTETLSEALPTGLGKKQKQKKQRRSRRSSCPDKQKFYPNKESTCKKRKMVWHKKSKRCVLRKR